MQTPTPSLKRPTTADFSFYPLLAVLVWTGNTLVTKMAAGAIEPAAILVAPECIAE